MNRHDVYRLVRNELSKNYWIYKFFANRNGAMLLDNNTELVIEGFPRSANSFLEAAIRQAADRPLSLAHHTHSRSHVEEAVRLKIPCVVLIRNPIDAMVSYFEESGKLSSSNVLLREYDVFYRGLRRYNREILFVNFDSLIRDPGNIVREIDDRLELLLGLDPSLNIDVQKTLDQVKDVAIKRVGIIPAYRTSEAIQKDPARDSRRRQIREKIETQSLPFLMTRAKEMHQDILRLAI